VTRNGSGLPGTRTGRLGGGQPEMQRIRQTGPGTVWGCCLQPRSGGHAGWCRQLSGTTDWGPLELRVLGWGGRD